MPLLHTSRYVIPRDSVLQAFPRVSTASDKCWGEKAWVRGWAYCTNLGPPIAFAKCVVCIATVILARLYYYHSLSYLVSKSNLFV